MSGYQRMVSYLYRYDKGIKGKNTGYARIERNDRRCRVTIRLQDMVSVSPVVSFFIQNGRKMQLIPAGKLVRNGGGFAGRIETPIDHMAGSQYAFDRIDGIYLSGSEEVFYATTWKEIAISELSVADAKGNQAEPETGEEETAENRADVGNIEAPPAREDRVETGGNQAAASQTASEYAETSTREDRKETGGNQAAASQTTPEYAEAPEAKRTETAPGMDETPSVEACSHMERPGFGERMLRMFPPMYPFEIAEIEHCVRIDLKDLCHLPVAHWSLAGNPFLLRGYYCYRHLIFAGLAGNQYAVGVPGIYSEENDRWAKECRMLRFQPLSGAKDRYGAFGYWLYPVPDKGENVFIKGHGNER